MTCQDCTICQKVCVCLSRQHEAITLKGIFFFSVKNCMKTSIPPPSQVISFEKAFWWKMPCSALLCVNSRRTGAWFFQYFQYFLVGESILHGQSLFAVYWHQHRAPWVLWPLQNWGLFWHFGIFIYVITCEGSCFKYLLHLGPSPQQRKGGKDRIHAEMDRNYVLQTALSINLNFFAFLLLPILSFLCTANSLGKTFRFQELSG